MSRSVLARPETPRDYAAALAGAAHRFRHVGILAVAGADRAAFLQGQLTQDLRTLVPGGSLPAAGLSPKGKILYFGRVVALPERLLLVGAGLDRPFVQSHLAKYAAFQKATIADATNEFCVVALYGPAAADIQVPEYAERLPAEGEFAAGILSPARRRQELELLLAAAGSTPLGPETGEVLRVEAGRPRFGSEADENTLPDEIHLSAAISTSKGCYVGQEVVARLRTYGRVNRRLVGLRFPAAPVPPGTVFPDADKPGLELGRVTSAALSPRFGPIGLGLAFRDVALGATLADAGHPERQAVIAPLPFA